MRLPEIDREIAQAAQERSDAINKMQQANMEAERLRTELDKAKRENIRLKNYIVEKLVLCDEE